jgi:hypothetical protein
VSQRPTSKYEIFAQERYDISVCCIREAGGHLAVVTRRNFTDTARRIGFKRYALSSTRGPETQSRSAFCAAHPLLDLKFEHESWLLVHLFVPGLLSRDASRRDTLTVISTPRLCCSCRDEGVKSGVRCGRRSATSRKTIAITSPVRLHIEKGTALRRTQAVLAWRRFSIGFCCLRHIESG